VEGCWVERWSGDGSRDVQLCSVKELLDGERKCTRRPGVSDWFCI